MKRYINFSVFILIICLSILSGCTDNITDTSQGMPSNEKDTLYQVSTINSLIAGNYDGFRSIGELKKNGDVGIGTLDISEENKNATALVKKYNMKFVFETARMYT